ncbi:MAG: B12-binding domain-containing radical SAM protein [Candidatus Bathyarchaeia archaeon]
MKVVLTADRTNMLNHKVFFLTGFLATVPREVIHPVVRPICESVVFSKPPSNGREATLALYGMRKIEAALIEADVPVEVVPWNKLDEIDKVDVFGVSAMDPLGCGPATTTARMFLGGTPYNRYYFEKLIDKLREFQKPIIVGGSGAWQFEVFPEEQDRLGIDCVLVGDGEEAAPQVFRMATTGNKLPKIVHSSQPSRIPLIKKPAYWGFVEVSRGCDRACQFCDPAMKKFRWMSLDHILEEVKVNLRFQNGVTLHSEDVFRYGCRHGEWKPNGKLINLFRAVRHVGARWIVITHGTLSSAHSSPELIGEMAKLMKTNPEDYAGVQVGLETGSTRLIAKYMRGKALPYTPEEWPSIASQAFELLTENRIIPAATLIIGLPGETAEDVDQTIELVKQLEKYPSMIVPLAFVPLGLLRKQHFPKELKSDAYIKLYSTCARHNAYWTRTFSRHWQGRMALGPDFIAHIGAMLMWKGAEAMEARRNVSQLRVAAWATQETALFLAHRAEATIKNNKWVLELATH